MADEEVVDERPENEEGEKLNQDGSVSKRQPEEPEDIAAKERAQAAKEEVKVAEAIGDAGKAVRKAEKAVEEAEGESAEAVAEAQAELASAKDDLVKAELDDPTHQATTTQGGSTVLTS